jgi:2-keto-4-pentenoate hydratase
LKQEQRLRSFEHFSYAPNELSIKWWKVSAKSQLIAIPRMEETMEKYKVDLIGSSIVRAYTGVPIAPIRGELSGIDAAYEVQRWTVNHWIGTGKMIAGRKIGITSKAVQQQLGVDEPDFGTIFSDMIVQSGSTIPSASVLQPRVEAEIAFVLAKDIVGACVTAEEVIAATDYVCPALEICGSRIAGWDIKITDTVADNASAGMVVLGAERHRATLDMLPAVSMRVLHNGAMSVEGDGAACLGNPAIAVAWLANALNRFGEGLKRGDVVMSGALAKMVAASPGDTFIADFGGFGRVETRFS